MSAQRDLDRLVQEMKGRAPLRASAVLITIFAVIGAVFVWAWAYRDRRCHPRTRPGRPRRRCPAGPGRRGGRDPGGLC